MALTRANPDDVVASALYNEIVGLINGTTGAGQPVRFTDYNNSTTFSTIFGNQDTTAGLISRFQHGDIASPTVVLDITKAGILGKLRDKSGFEFNLEAYAAAGTTITVSGGTDPDVAWAAALGAAGAVNGTVIVGPGTFYGPSASVTMPDNVIIKGCGRKGTTFMHRVASKRQVFNFVGRSNCWLTDCTIDGNRTNNNSSDPNVAFTNDNEVAFQSCFDCGAMNVWVTNWNAGGFLCNGTRTSLINCGGVGQGSLTVATGNYTQLTDWPSPVTVVGHTADNLLSTGNLGSIYVFDTSGETVQDLYMERCYASGTRSAGFNVGADGLIMTDCIVEVCHGAYWPDEGVGHARTPGAQIGINVTGTGLVPSSRVLINNLTVRVSTATAPANVIELGGAKNITITNSHFIVNQLGGGVIVGGSGTSGERVKISDCTFEASVASTSQEGIQVNDTTAGMTISNCSFKGLGIAGITLKGTTDNVTLIGNRFEGCTANLVDTSGTSIRQYWGNMHHAGAPNTGVAIPNRTILTLAADYATTIRNTSASGHGLAAISDNIVIDALNHTSGAAVMRVTAAGLMHVNDTTNVGMTQGLNIQQGSNDDFILAFKSSDVSHGMTGITGTGEGDTYVAFKKQTAATGGLAMYCLDGTATNALAITSYVGAATATRSTVGVAPIILSGALKTGTSASSVGADKNILAVQDAGTTRFIIDSDGDVFADAGGGAVNEGHGYSIYDEFDDVQLVRVLDIQRGGRGLIETEFDEILRYNRADLEALGIVQFNDHEAGDGSIFVNYSALTRLHSGALWQQHQRIATLEATTMARLERLESLALPGGSATA